MKRALILLGIIALVGLTSKAFSADEVSYQFKVTGMHCDMCPKAVEKAAKSVKGVKEVKLTLIEGKWKNGGILDVRADKNVKAGKIISAIEKADKSYRAEEVKAANPCGTPENPCGMKNPCGGASNPCGMK